MAGVFVEISHTIRSVALMASPRRPRFASFYLDEFEALGTYTGVLHRHITDIYNFLSASYNNEFCAECAECAGMRKKYCSFYDLHNILIICVL
jgi:hypothetical protein